MRCVRSAAFAVSAAVAVAGCHTFQLDVSREPGTSVVEQRNAFYLGGGLPTTLVLDASERCPEGVSRIHESITFTDVLITVATLTLYSPRTTTYHCIGEAAR